MVPASNHEKITKNGKFTITERTGIHFFHICSIKKNNNNFDISGLRKSRKNPIFCVFSKASKKKFCGKFFVIIFVLGIITIKKYMYVVQKIFIVWSWKKFFLFSFGPKRRIFLTFLEWPWSKNFSMKIKKNIDFFCFRRF